MNQSIDSIFALQGISSAQTGGHGPETITDGADFAALLAGIVTKGANSASSGVNTTIRASANIENGTVQISLKDVSVPVETTGATVNSSGNVVPGMLTVKTEDGSEIDIPVLLVKESVDAETENAVVAVLIPAGFIEALVSLNQTVTVQDDAGNDIVSEVSETPDLEDIAAIPGELTAVDKPQLQETAQKTTLTETAAIPGAIVIDNTLKIDSTLDLNNTLDKSIGENLALNNDITDKAPAGNPQKIESPAIKDISEQGSAPVIVEKKTTTFINEKTVNLLTDDEIAFAKKVPEESGESAVTPEDTLVRIKSGDITLKSVSSSPNFDLVKNSDTVTDNISPAGKYYLVYADTLETSSTEGIMQPFTVTTQEVAVGIELSAAQISESGIKDVSGLIGFIQSKISGAKPVLIEQFTASADFNSAESVPVELTGSENETVSMISPDTQLTDFADNSASGFLRGLEMSNTGIINRMNIKNTVFVLETKTPENNTPSVTNSETVPPVELTSDIEAAADINLPAETKALDISAGKTVVSEVVISESIPGKTDVKAENAALSETLPGKTDVKTENAALSETLPGKTDVKTEKAIVSESTPEKTDVKAEKAALSETVPGKTDVKAEKSILPESTPEKTDVKTENAVLSETVPGKTDVKTEKAIVLESDSEKAAWSDKDLVDKNRPVADYKLKASSEKPEPNSNSAQRVSYEQTENTGNLKTVKTENNVAANDDNSVKLSSNDYAAKSDVTSISDTIVKSDDAAAKSAVTVKSPVLMDTKTNVENLADTAENNNVEKQIKINETSVNVKTIDIVNTEKTPEKPVNETMTAVNQSEKTNESEDVFPVKNSVNTESVNTEIMDKTTQKDNSAGTQEKTADTGQSQKPVNKTVIENGEYQLKVSSAETDNEPAVKIPADSYGTVKPVFSKITNNYDTKTEQTKPEVKTVVYIKSEETENIPPVSDKAEAEVIEKNAAKSAPLENDIPKEQTRTSVKTEDTTIADKPDIDNVIKEKVKVDITVSPASEKTAQTESSVLYVSDDSQVTLPENETGNLTMKQKPVKITSSGETGKTEIQTDAVIDNVKSSSVDIKKPAVTSAKSLVSDSPDETSDSDVNTISIVNPQSKTEKSVSGNNENAERGVESQVQDSSGDFVRRISRNEKMKNRSSSENDRAPLALPRKVAHTATENQNSQSPIPFKGIELTDSSALNSSAGNVFSNGESQFSMNLQSTASTFGTDWKTQIVLSQRESANGRMVYKYDDKQFVDNIVRQAKMLSSGGLNGMVISLDPPSLGRMKLDIVTDNSKITGKILVESIEVKNLIQNNMSQLREALSQSGLMVESFDVQVGNNGGSGTWENAENYKSAMKSLRDSRNNLIDNISPEIGRETGSIRNRITGNSVIDFWV